jgi:hypothetical protein
MVPGRRFTRPKRCSTAATMRSRTSSPEMPAVVATKLIASRSQQSSAKATRTRSPFSAAISSPSEHQPCCVLPRPPCPRDGVSRLHPRGAGAEGRAPSSRGKPASRSARAGPPARRLGAEAHAPVDSRRSAGRRRAPGWRPKARHRAEADGHDDAGRSSAGTKGGSARRPALRPPRSPAVPRPRAHAQGQLFGGGHALHRLALRSRSRASSCRAGAAVRGSAGERRGARRRAPPPRRHRPPSARPGPSGAAR